MSRFDEDLDKLIEIINQWTPVTPQMEIRIIRWLGDHDKGLIENCRDIALKAVGGKDEAKTL